MHPGGGNASRPIGFSRGFFAPAGGRRWSISFSDGPPAGQRPLWAAAHLPRKGRQSHMARRPSSGPSGHLLPGGEKRLQGAAAPPLPSGRGGKPPGLAFGKPEDRLSEPVRGNSAVICDLPARKGEIAYEFRFRQSSTQQNKAPPSMTANLALVGEMPGRPEGALFRQRSTAPPNPIQSCRTMAPIALTRMRAAVSADRLSISAGG